MAVIIGLTFPPRAGADEAPAKAKRPARKATAKEA